MTGTFGPACVIVCLALFSKFIDGYVVSAPHDTVAVLGDRVELDCFINTSGPVEWHLIRNGSSDIGGSSKDVWISRGNETRFNVSSAFRIRHDVVGQFSLVIDPVLLSLAGRYRCYDAAEEETHFAEVAVLNGTPSCEESSPTRSPSRKIVCSFGYTSWNLKPELEWMTLGNSSWNALCNASSNTNTVDCIFESSCTVQNQPVNANTLLIKCLGENSTCKWGNISSSVGSLQIKSSNKTVGSWHCSSTGVSPSPTTSPNPTVTDASSHEKNIPLLLISVGVTSTAIILLLFILRIKYGICRKKGTAHDVLYDRATDQVDPTQTQTETITVASGYVTSEPENSPMYAQVQKKRKAPPKNAVNGHDNLIIENSLYASGKTSGVAKTATEVSRNKFATDDIIYADLRQVPRDTSSSRIQRAPMVIREGFDTSTYAFIDHNLRAPALLPK